MPKGNAKKKSILDNHERYGAEGGAAAVIWPGRGGLVPRGLPRMVCKCKLARGSRGGSVGRGRQSYSGKRRRQALSKLTGFSVARTRTTRSAVTVDRWSSVVVEAGGGRRAKEERSMRETGVVGERGTGS